MAWYETRDGERDYVFGKGGGQKLAEELQVELLAQIPLRAPETTDPSDPLFSPSIYSADHPIGQLYERLATRVIEKTN